MGKRILLAAMSLAVLTAAIAVPASAGAKQTLLIGNCAKPKFKPANLIFACGDASFGATGVTWSSWTRKSANGSGTGQINDCNPDCAHGHPHSAAINVTANRPRTCSNGRRIFTKLSFSWASGASPVANFPASGSIPAGCKLLNL
jgi:hypothetical protein